MRAHMGKWYKKSSFGRDCIPRLAIRKCSSTWSSGITSNVTETFNSEQKEEKDRNDNVIKEYIAYKLYEQISPYHFNTRLVNIELTEKRVLIEIKSLKNDIGGRVGTLERYKWVIMGGALAIGWILSKNLMPLLHMMNGA